MIGLERNTHSVGMACYAPMLANVDYVNWKPDMIWFHNHEAFGTPNYYVQKLFMNHLGKYQLPITLEAVPKVEILSNTESIPGTLALGNHESEVIYSDIRIINEETKEVMSFPDCHIGLEENEVIQLTEVNGKNYTLSLKAEEKQGHKGFQIYFGKQGDDNYFCWTLGGWQNQDNIICERVNGRDSVLGHDVWEGEKNYTYELLLEVRGRVIKAYIDGVMYQEIVCKPTVVEQLYTSAQQAKNGEIIFKVVNVSNRDCEVELYFSDNKACKEQVVDIVYMEGYKKEETNSFEKPDFISPRDDKHILTTKDASFVFPKNSIYILRLKQ
jgi:alpha-L-arabinofuranosidase